MTNVHLGNRACAPGSLDGVISAAGVYGKTGIYARSTGEVRLLPRVNAAASALKPQTKTTPTTVTPFITMDRHPWVRTWRPPV